MGTEQLLSEAGSGEPPIDIVEQFIETAGEEELHNATTELLLDTYNRLTGRNTTKFESREKGIAQVAKALTDHRRNAFGEPKEAPTKSVTGKKAKAVRSREGGSEDQTEPRKEKKTREVAHRNFRIKLPFNGGTPKVPKEGSKRARLLARMLDGKGITIEEAMSEYGWARKDAYEGIRLIHVALGYGLKQDEEGRVTAHTTPPGAK